MEIKFEQKGVMVIADIEMGVIDELVQAVIEGIAMDEELFGGQTSVEPATEVSSGR